MAAAEVRNVAQSAPEIAPLAWILSSDITPVGQILDGFFLLAKPRPCTPRYNVFVKGEGEIVTGETADRSLHHLRPRVCPILFTSMTKTIRHRAGLSE